METKIMSFTARKCLIAVAATSCLMASASVTHAELLVANLDGNAISRVDGLGNVTTFALASVNGPIQIAIDAHGNVYTSNGFDGTITKFSADGTHLGKFATVPGGAAGGIAFDSAGVLHAGGWTTGDGHVYQFSSTGANVGQFPEVFHNDPNIGFGGASFFAMAFDATGDLFATDDFFGFLYHFDSDGNLVDSLRIADGSLLSNPGAPYGLAIDQANTIYVGITGTSQNEIHMFSNTGADLGTFASNLAGIPTGLTFDPSGNLYASIYDTGEVLKFGSDGKPLGVFASGLVGPTGIEFRSPSAVSEPTSIALLAVGGIGASIRYRRRKRVTV